MSCEDIKVSHEDLQWHHAVTWLTCGFMSGTFHRTGADRPSRRRPPRRGIGRGAPAGRRDLAQDIPRACLITPARPNCPRSEPVPGALSLLPPPERVGGKGLPTVMTSAATWPPRLRPDPRRPRRHRLRQGYRGAGRPCPARRAGTSGVEPDAQIRCALPDARHTRKVPWHDPVTHTPLIEASTLLDAFKIDSWPLSDVLSFPPLIGAAPKLRPPQPPRRRAGTGPGTPGSARAARRGAAPARRPAGAAARTGSNAGRRTRRPPAARPASAPAPPR